MLMNMQRKRVVSLLCGAAIAAMILAGCSQPAVSQSSQSNSEDNLSSESSSAVYSEESSESPEPAPSNSASSGDDVIAPSEESPEPPVEDDSEAAESAASAEAEAIKAELTEKYEDIKTRRAGDSRFGGTTMDMMNAGNDFVAEYDALIEEIITRMQTLPDIDADALQAEQQTWSEEAKAQAQASADEAGGGSMTGINYLGTMMTMQEERIETLLGMMG